jgi:signal transduction histidine kinase
MRLAELIRTSTGAIIRDWEAFARTLEPASNDKSPLVLRNHIKEILAFIADDIDSAQTAAEQISKSRGDQVRQLKQSAAEIHAALRLAGGFDTDQMVSEYRALRASVIRLWTAQPGDENDLDISQLTRFNESIDQQLSESIGYYSKAVDRAKDMLLGILGHDLRSPIGAARMSAKLALSLGSLNERQTMLLTQVVESADRATRVVASLLDLAGARLGSGLPIVKEKMDIGFVGRQLVEETRALHPNRTITLEVAGDTDGEWDKPRIGQIFSNLLGNAVQYGFKDLPIEVLIRGCQNEVAISVHNGGVPIPKDSLGALFDPLVRGDVEGGGDGQVSMNLGLGLFIIKEIVSAHGGQIDVTSSEKGGTTFTARLPRSN